MENHGVGQTWDDTGDRSGVLQSDNDDVIPDHHPIHVWEHRGSFQGKDKLGSTQSHRTEWTKSLSSSSSSTSDHQTLATASFSRETSVGSSSWSFTTVASISSREEDALWELESSSSSPSTLEGVVQHAWPALFDPSHYDSGVEGAVARKNLELTPLKQALEYSYVQAQLAEITAAEMAQVIAWWDHPPPATPASTCIVTSRTSQVEAYPQNVLAQLESSREDDNYDDDQVLQLRRQIDTNCHGNEAWMAVQQEAYTQLYLSCFWNASTISSHVHHGEECGQPSIPSEEESPWEMLNQRESPVDDLKLHKENQPLHLETMTLCSDADESSLKTPEMMETSPSEGSESRSFSWSLESPREPRPWPCTQGQQTTSERMHQSARGQQRQVDRICEATRFMKECLQELYTAQVEPCHQDNMDLPPPRLNAYEWAFFWIVAQQTRIQGRLAVFIWSLVPSQCLSVWIWLVFHTRRRFRRRMIGLLFGLGLLFMISWIRAVILLVQQSQHPPLMLVAFHLSKAPVQTPWSRTLFDHDSAATPSSPEVTCAEILLQSEESWRL